MTRSARRRLPENSCAPSSVKKFPSSCASENFVSAMSDLHLPDAFLGAGKAHVSSIDLLRSGCSPVLEPRFPGNDAGVIDEVGLKAVVEEIEDDIEAETEVETASLEDEGMHLRNSDEPVEVACLRKPGVSFAEIVNAKQVLPESGRGKGPSPVFNSWTNILLAASSSHTPDALKAAGLLHGLAAATTDMFCLPDDKRVANCSKWKNSLIGKFHGSSPLFKDIVTEAGRRWGLMHEDIFSFPNSFFCFRFKSEAELCDALSKGPLMVRGRLMSSMKWKEDFHWFRDKISTSPVWLRFDGLLPEFWDEETILNIAKYFGKPLMVDECTRRADRFHFARVCVEIDLAAPLKGGIWLKGGGKPYLQTVAYEDVPSVCFVCGRAGHQTGACSKAHPTDLKAVMMGCESKVSIGLPIYQERVQGEGVVPEIQAVGQGSGQLADGNSQEPALPATVCDIEALKGGSVQASLGPLGGSDIDAQGVVCAPGLGPWITVHRRRGLRRFQGPPSQSLGRQNQGMTGVGFRGGNQAVAGLVQPPRVTHVVSLPPVPVSPVGNFQKNHSQNLLMCAVPVTRPSPTLAGKSSSSIPPVCLSPGTSSSPVACTAPVGEVQAEVERPMVAHHPVVSNSFSAVGETCEGVFTTGQLCANVSGDRLVGLAPTSSLTPDPFLTIDLSNPVTKMDGGKLLLPLSQVEEGEIKDPAAAALETVVVLEGNEQMGVRPPLH